MVVKKHLKSNKGETLVTVLIAMLIVLTITIGSLETIDSALYESNKLYYMDEGNNITIIRLNEIKRKFYNGTFDAVTDGVLETNIDFRTKAVTYVTFQEIVLADTGDIRDINYVGSPELEHTGGNRKSYRIEAYTTVNNKRAGNVLSLIITERQ